MEVSHRKKSELGASYRYVGSLYQIEKRFGKTKGKGRQEREEEERIKTSQEDQRI